jgi:hypothetical protein
MVGVASDPEWPDKAVYSAMILTLAGALGIMFSLLRMLDAVGENESLPILYLWPPWIMLLLSVATTTLGGFGVRHHSALFVYSGAATGMASLAALGLVPVLCFAAIGFMIRAHIEGEDTSLATPTPPPEDWPDKAMAASMLLFVTGLLTLFQAGLTFADQVTLQPFGADMGRFVWGAWLVVAGVFCAWASWEIYHLRRPWSGAVGGVVGILALGLYIVGPLLAIVALVMMALAARENEFHAHAA